MGEGGGEGDGFVRELDQTPTWAVAAVCAVIILISILLEKVLHHVAEWFTERKKRHMVEALEKVKAELMILGFISLLLTFGQNYITRMCITEEAADTMLPCLLKPETLAHEWRGGAGHQPESAGAGEGEHAEGGGGSHGAGEGEHVEGGGAGEGEHVEGGGGGHGAGEGEHVEGGGGGHGAVEGGHVEGGGGGEAEEGGEGHHRRLLWHIIMNLNSKRRVLSEHGPAPSCPRGKVPMITINGLHQLHIFIFFLAVFHVLYSALTMVLGRLKIRAWKEWERETSSVDYDISNDPKRFRLTHETSFVKQHTSLWNKIAVSFYIVSFFRQFVRSVRKADYLYMRHGFITVHLAPGSKFDFQKYIKRSLEDDFKTVVGISPGLWLSAVLFLLLNVNGWQTLLWISIMPLIIILAVGTKLQAIITEMALEITERHAVVQGIPLVQVSDHHFWFGRPHLVLTLIHFTLFQNAFQLIYLFWIWYEFGWDSCFHQSPKLIIARVCLGVGVQVLCSYITLPLYALVSQMGSQMKRSIFDEQTSKALKKWRDNAKKKNVKPSANSPSRSPAISPKGSPKAPITNQVQRTRTLGRSPTRRRNTSDQEMSVMEADMPSSTATVIPMEQGDLLTGSGHQPHKNDDEFFLVKL